MKVYLFTSIDIFNILRMSTLEQRYFSIFTETISYNDTTLSEYVKNCFCDYLISYCPITESHLTTEDYDCVFKQFEDITRQFSLKQLDVRIISHCNSLNKTPLDQHLELLAPEAFADMTEPDLLTMMLYVLQEIESRFLISDGDNSCSYVLFATKHDNLIVFVQ